MTGFLNIWFKYNVILLQHFISIVCQVPKCILISWHLYLYILPYSSEVIRSLIADVIKAMEDINTISAPE